MTFGTGVPVGERKESRGQMSIRKSGWDKLSKTMIQRVTLYVQKAERIPIGRIPIEGGYRGQGASTNIHTDSFLFIHSTWKAQ